MEIMVLSTTMEKYTLTENTLVKYIRMATSILMARKEENYI